MSHELSTTSSTSARHAETAPPKSIPEPLLPDWIKRPFLILWVGVLPQAVLVLMNLRAYSIIAGEMEPWQRTAASGLFALQVCLLVASGVGALAFRARRKYIPLWGAAAFLLFPVGYLWFFVYQIAAGILPASVTVWILPPDQLLYYQFALMMPAVFYGGIRLSCANLELSRGREWLILGGIVLGVPLCWFLAAQSDGWLGILRAIPVVIAVGVALIATSFMLGASARACVLIYVVLRRRGPRALAIFSFIVALVAPLGGLWLNALIPFPSDFQTWPVYAMAAANGLVLLLPNFRSLWLHRLVWLAQCAFFPFTLYFFLVFLPFLPLSLPAMLYIGAGFLVLTPTLLFLLHGRRIADGYSNEIRDGSRTTPALLAAVAFLILPGIYVGQAVTDRVALRRAVDYIYAPDFRQPDHFSGSRVAVKRSLERLRDFQAGVNLPFLSDFYNWVVFDNLVLPVDKMNAMHRAFFGRELPATESDRAGFFGGGRTSRPRAAVELPHNVALVDLTSATREEGACSRTTLTLELENKSARQSEYVTQIKIPEGAFVSGYWLKIGDERVPGQIFEKKTALWVYQQIRDRSRRDPGILVYSDPHTIQLRVFPLEKLERRQTEIEFFYPTTLQPTVQIGERQWKAAGDNAGLTLATTSGKTSALSIAPTALTSLPRTERTPYLHFIVERSANGKGDSTELVRRVREAAKLFGAAKDCAVTVANYEGADLAPDLTAIDEVDPAIFAKAAFPQRGGFLAERAVKRALLAYHDRVSHATPDSPWLRRFPIVIVLPATTEKLSFDADLAHFGSLVPETDALYIVRSDGSSGTQYFDGRLAGGITSVVHPIALLQVGDAVAACRLDATESQMVTFQASGTEPTLGVFDAGKFTAIEPTATIPPGAPYSRGVSAWQRYLALIENPSLGSDGLSKIVSLSRETGILLGATSYIAVENSAQRKMLELKERQKLGNQNVLEFESIPEPATWILLLSGGVFLVYVVRKRTAFPEC